MTVNHCPSVLRALRARLDHRPHFDQPRAYDQIPDSYRDSELNSSQELCRDHDIDDTPASPAPSERPDYDLFYPTSSHVSIRHPGPNGNPILRGRDKNADADHRPHRHQLRARSSDTR